MPKTQPAGKKTSPLLFVGVGCIVLIVLISLGSFIVGKLFAKKIAVGVLQTAIEKQTGVKTNLQDVENGKMTFTDSKTGAKVDIGTGKVPDNFPKDFPLYTGAKVVSAMSGNQSGSSNGFWLTMSTTDSVDKVAAFYKSKFASGGWVVGTTYTAGGTFSQTVEKGQWSGSVAISEDTSSKETQIVVILDQQETTPPPDTSAGGGGTGY